LGVGFGGEERKVMRESGIGGWGSKVEGLLGENNGYLNVSRLFCCTGEEEYIHFDLKVVSV
jgi:hypothetical protein